MEDDRRINEPLDIKFHVMHIFNFLNNPNFPPTSLSILLLMPPKIGECCPFIRFGCKPFMHLNVNCQSER
eukprot:scaffold6564_cov179-Skeletonema_marinoi.AAC.6